METVDYGYEDPKLIRHVGEGRHSVERWHADVMCVFSALFMFACSGIITWIGRPKFLKQDVEFWKYRNIFVSWINGLILGIWEFLCIWWYPDLMKDPVFYINNFVYLLPPFAVGYFIYDVVDYKMSKKLKQHWEVGLHHLVLIIGLWYDWHIKLCVSYCVILLLAEINSIFLHLRKLLQFAQVGFDSLFYRAITILNVITFIGCRLIPQSMVVVGLFLDFHRVPKGYFILPAITVPIGFTINIVLFWRIIKTDVLRSIGGQGKKKKV